jgi:hypothetical protein
VEQHQDLWTVEICCPLSASATIPQSESHPPSHISIGPSYSHALYDAYAVPLMPHTNTHRRPSSIALFAKNHPPAPTCMPSSQTAKAKTQLIVHYCYRCRCSMTGMGTKRLEAKAAVVVLPSPWWGARILALLSEPASRR